MPRELKVVWVGAPWCPSCKVGKPTTLQHCLANDIDFDELCAEEDTMAVAQLSVSSLPTAIVYRSGLEIGRWEGAYPPARVAKMITDIVNFE